MNSGYNPNFRGRCAYDSVAELSPIPINIVPPIPIDLPHFPPIIDLSCGTTGNVGDITTLCAFSIYRTDSIVSNRKYYARTCTFTAPEGALLILVVSEFASYVTLWKDVNHYWTSTNGTLAATIDSTTSGVLALEITTVSPYATGAFTIDLSCGGGGELPASTTVITSSQNPSTPLQEVVFTVTVSSPSGTPTGFVSLGDTYTTPDGTFYRFYGTQALTDGVAIFTVSPTYYPGGYVEAALNSGTHVFRADLITDSWQASYGTVTQIVTGTVM